MQAFRLNRLEINELTKYKFKKMFELNYSLFDENGQHLLAI